MTERMREAWGDFRVAVGLDEPAEDPEASLLEQVEEYLPALTWDQRLKGFGITFVLGLLVSVSASLNWGNPRRFAALYTVGNLVSMCGGLFLWGPMRQVKAMFDETRWMSTVAYMLTIVGTLFAALYLENLFLTLFFMAAQFLALAWYCLSFIPGARTAVTALFTACFG